MERRDLEGAAASYWNLRGLLAVPAGLLFILAALGNWQVGPLRHDWVFVAGLLAIGGAYLLINRYYQEHYGRMSPSSRQQLPAAAALVLGVALVFGGSLLLRSRAGWSLDLPVNPIAVTFSILMLAGYAIGGVLRAHHVAVWGTLLVAGALPVWTGADPSNVGLVLCGAAVIVCGVLDHLAFVRTFGPPELPQLGNGNARA
jgi:hypothetical protein